MWLGVDGCRQGWFCMVLGENDTPFGVFPSLLIRYFK